MQLNLNPDPMIKINNDKTVCFSPTPIMRIQQNVLIKMMRAKMQSLKILTTNIVHKLS